MRLDALMSVGKLPPIDDGYLIIPSRVSFPIAVLAGRHVSVVDVAQHYESRLSDGEGTLGTFIHEDKFIVLLDLYRLFERHSPERFKQPSIEQRPTHLLLAEDSPFFQNLIRSYLEHPPRQLTVVADGEAALNLLQAHPDQFDMLVSDIEMPRMDGFTLVKKIRADPTLRGLPVIAVTSLATPEHIERGIQAGFDSYMIKVDKEALSRDDRPIRGKRRQVSGVVRPTAGGLTVQIVTFAAAGGVHGIPVLAVEELLRPVPVTPVPRSDPRVAGLMNLRGKSATVLHLRACFARPTGEPARDPKMILLETADRLTDEARELGVKAFDDPVVLLVDAHPGHFLGRSQGRSPTPGPRFRAVRGRGHSARRRVRFPARIDDADLQHPQPAGLIMATVAPQSSAPLQQPAAGQAGPNGPAAEVTFSIFSPVITVEHREFYERIVSELNGVFPICTQGKCTAVEVSDDATEQEQITDLMKRVESFSGELLEVTKQLFDQFYQAKEHFCRMIHGATAYLKINLMDRNLLERTCDVRWWALEMAFSECLETRDSRAGSPRPGPRGGAGRPGRGRVRPAVCRRTPRWEVDAAANARLRACLTCSGRPGCGLSRRTRNPCRATSKRS